MNKITNWDTYKEAEKKLIWQDFFIRILMMLGVMGSTALACYALYWFIHAALKTPILIVYAIVAIVGICYIVSVWNGVHERSNKRILELNRAKVFQEDAEEWEVKLHKYMETPENETEEEYKERQNNISHAQTSHEYYLGRRDEAMYEYRKLGGKKYE